LHVALANVDEARKFIVALLQENIDIGPGFVDIVA